MTYIKQKFADGSKIQTREIAKGIGAQSFLSPNRSVVDVLGNCVGYKWGR